MADGQLNQVKGTNVLLPPAGQVSYFTDASGSLKQVTSAGVVTAVGNTIATPTGGFGLMAARAAAWGAALATPYVFQSAYQEDFALGSLTVANAVGGSGTVPTYSTTATNYGSAGIMQSQAAGVTNADFATAGPLNTNAWIADLKNTTFYQSSYAKLTGVQAQTFSASAVGVLGAAAVAANSKFVLVGVIRGASTTNWGFTLYDGVTQTYHASATVAFDQAAFHYLDLAHDAVAHVYYFYVDGVLVDSVSDAGMAASIGGTPWATYAACVLLGVQIDKAYCAV